MTDPIVRIEAALRRLGEDHEPPVGWEDRVLAATRQPTVRPFYTHHWFLVFVPVLALAGLLLWLVVFHRSPNDPQELAVNLRIEPKTSVRGDGSGGTKGDVVHASAAGEHGYRMLRVYRHGVLILGCAATPDGTVSEEVITHDAASRAGASPCTGDRDTLDVSLVLDAIGDYKLLGVASAAPLPASQHSFDLDLAYAIRANLRRANSVKSFEVK